MLQPWVARTGSLWYSYCCHYAAVPDRDLQTGTWAPPHYLVARVADWYALIPNSKNPELWSVCFQQDIFKLGSSTFLHICQSISKHAVSQATLGVKPISLLTLLSHCTLMGRCLLLPPWWPTSLWTSETLQDPVRTGRLAKLNPHHLRGGFVCLSKQNRSLSLTPLQFTGLGSWGWLVTARAVSCCGMMLFKNTIKVIHLLPKANHCSDWSLQFQVN